MKKTFSFLLALVMIVSLFAFPSFASVGGAVPFENSVYFESGDYRLHYRTYGDPVFNGGKVMLLHGFGLSTASLEGIAEEYENANYYVVTVDLPNFGYSSRETSDTALQSREELVFSLMKKLGGSWILGGHSMGGGIAINVAVDHPESVKGLVLFAPQPSSQITGAASSIMKSKLMQAVFGSIIGLVKYFPGLVRPLVALSFSDSVFAKTYDENRISAPLSIKGTGAGMAVMASHTRGTDLEAFSSLNCPVVIVTAENDRVANAHSLREILLAAPDGTVHESVEKGGHMMMEYDPQGVAARTLKAMETMK